MIINSSYRGDIIDSVDSLDQAHTLTKDITDVLKTDFHIKEWVISFECRVTSIKLQMFEAENELERVLGILWYVKGDYLSFIVKLNFSKKEK